MTDQESPAPAPGGMPPPTAPPSAPAWGAAPFGQTPGGGAHGAMPGMNAPPVTPEEHYEHIGAHNYGKDGEVRIIKQVPIDKRLSDDYTPYLKVGGLVLLVLALIGGALFGAFKIFGGEDEPEVAAVEPTTTTAPADATWERQTPREGSFSMEMPPTSRRESSVETATGTATTTLLFADRGEFAIAAGEVAFPAVVEMDIETAAAGAMAQIDGEVVGLDQDLSGYLEAADVEGSGTWEGKSVIIRARLQKIPSGAAIFLGIAPQEQVEAMRLEFDRMFGSFSVNE